MIHPDEYHARRQQLAQQLKPNSVALVPAGRELLRNGDAHYRFRQDSYFYYLTGFEEPDAFLVIFSGKESRSVLFNRPHDKAMEQWTGRRLGQNDAASQLKVDEAFSIHDLKSKLPALLADKEHIYYTLDKHHEYDPIVLNAIQLLKKQIRRGVTAPSNIRDLEPLIDEMRLFKSTGEIALMRQAARASVAGHIRAMQVCPQADMEYELEAELLYVFTQHGCRSVAYDSIVGCGENACVLHYTANNQPLSQGELVLIDAAGEFENYAADITRSFPVNGRFTAEQRAIYDLVLSAQQAGIACIRPGAPWSLVQETIVAILTAGLVDLGILKGNVNTLIEKEAYKPFYMHSSGHWLGLDVHDSGKYKVNGQWRSFEPNMVLTVEPGLYISADSHVDSRWHNIGVRIEDDILVTKTDHENLTAALPVDATEIEALMRG